MTFYIMLDGKGDLVSALGAKTLIKVDSAGLYGFYIKDLASYDLSDKEAALKALHDKSHDRRGVIAIPLAEAFAYKIVDDTATTTGAARVMEAAGLGSNATAAEQTLMLGSVVLEGSSLTVQFATHLNANVIKHGFAADVEENGVRKFKDITSSNVEEGQDSKYPFVGLISEIYSAQPAAKK